MFFLTRTIFVINQISKKKFMCKAAKELAIEEYAETSEANFVEVFPNDFDSANNNHIQA